MQPYQQSDEVRIHHILFRVSNFRNGSSGRWLFEYQKDPPYDLQFVKPTEDHWRSLNVVSPFYEYIRVKVSLDSSHGVSFFHRRKLSTVDRERFHNVSYYFMSHFEVNEYFTLFTRVRGN